MGGGRTDTGSAFYNRCPHVVEPGIKQISKEIVLGSDLHTNQFNSLDAEDTMHTEYSDYTDSKLNCEGFFAYEGKEKAKRPCVMIHHAWGGQSDFEREKAEELAKLGYVGFALDMYGKGNRGTNFDENAKLMQPFLDDRAMLLQRMKAALEHAKKHPMVDAERIASIGYCFGGLCVLDLARSGATVRGVVSFHGLFNPPNLGKQGNISAKVLILHGYDDPMARPDSMVEMANELTSANADWQIHAYGKTVHAFTNPEANMPDNGIMYDKKADKRSWQAMKNFLEEVFA